MHNLSRHALCAAVPQYYFPIQNGEGAAPDYEGMHLPDFEAAWLHAVAGARSMMSDSIRRGKLDLAAYIEIEDEHRAVLERVTFKDAVTISE